MTVSGGDSDEVVSVEGSGCGHVGVSVEISGCVDVCSLVEVAGGVHKSLSRIEVTEVGKTKFCRKVVLLVVGIYVEKGKTDS